MLIVYCENCSRRISDAEINSGKARRVDENRALCPECAPAHAPLPAAGPLRVRTPVMVAPTAAATKASGSSGGTSAVRIPKAVRSARSTEPARGGRQAGNNNAIVAICVVLGVILLGGGVMLMSHSSSQPPLKKEAEAPTLPLAAKPMKVDAAPIAPIAQPPVPIPVTNPVIVNLPPTAGESAQKPRNADNEMADFREELATTRLKEAKAFGQANPRDPWGYKDKLDDIAAHYRSTAAGQEAVKILADLKVPEKPKPAEPKGTGTFKAILDPKAPETLNSQCLNAWRSDGQAYINIPGVDNAAQTSGEFGEGEYHIRFEATAGSTVSFIFRQGSGGTNAVRFNGSHFAGADNGKVHELTFICQGDTAKATYDGKPATVQTEGAPRAGRVQFNVHDGNLKVLLIEWRKVEN